MTLYLHLHYTDDTVPTSTLHWWHWTCIYITLMTLYLHLHNTDDTVPTSTLHWWHCTCVYITLITLYLHLHYTDDNVSASAQEFNVFRLSWRLLTKLWLYFGLAYRIANLFPEASEKLSATFFSTNDFFRLGGELTTDAQTVRPGVKPLLGLIITF
jgi:hypothetical protein